MFFIIKLIFLFYVLKGLFSLFSDRGSGSSSEPRGGYGGRETKGESVSFEEALLKVLAAAMKADGRVTRSELDIVKQVLVTQFGEVQAKSALLRLRDILKTDFDTRLAAMRIGSMVSYSDRLRIAEILCLIVEADGIITESEVQTVVNLSYYMGLSNIDVQRVTSRLHVNGGERGYNNGGTGGRAYRQANSVTAAYKALGVGADATNEEVKTAYRNLVKKYHPDRYATQGEEAQKKAADKFKEIQDAYETIKAARGV